MKQLLKRNHIFDLMYIMIGFMGIVLLIYLWIRPMLFNNIDDLFVLLILLLGFSPIYIQEGFNRNKMYIYMRSLPVSTKLLYQSLHMYVLKICIIQIVLFTIVNLFFQFENRLTIIVILISYTLLNCVVCIRVLFEEKANVTWMYMKFFFIFILYINYIFFPFFERTNENQFPLKIYMMFFIVLISYLTKICMSQKRIQNNHLKI
ncbi:hypothetical protein DOS74_06085 [Staphylococcus felis]|uniref:Uncharacterized protein n=3 Tax=Staphylococcus felis TaxID=46127 RepID=A0A3E0IHD9_9STAP|nr:hypothetical protein [Staphylococcus felis]REH80062.1 hypothetical protein DOS59_02315 [Staphylococcus felis]REH83960.1 hypothetical protein DOS56_05045 [Staphylococcus felis]REH85371.1 hypothetical protein DOS61_04425 [Staphylococcus felis]REH87112.1 hypothetical protein DOS63_02130 [Staphylococcus felis]REH93010.1 hypothetical protein DOS83_09565 [Staphylococcus felis]